MSSPGSLISSTTSIQLQATSTGGVIHPSAGETVLYGSSYKIEWEPLDAPGSVSIELWDDDEWAWGSAFKGDSGARVGCDGWLVNSYCAKIASSVPNTGSHGLSRPFSTLSMPRGGILGAFVNCSC